jgi:hypothetical protein
MSDTLLSYATPLHHFVKRLQTVEIIPHPYPHYLLDHVFPEDFYQSLLRHLPDAAAYQNLFEITTLKLDHFRFRDQRDLADGWTASLPDELRRFWDEFNSWFLGPELAQAVLESFAEPMRSRFGARAVWPTVSVETQLIRHKAGFFLGPHTDLSTKLVVFLIYLAPDDNHQQLGTSLYRPKESGFTCPNSTHYPFEDFVRVTTAPYRRNSLLAFERSDRSFHGVEPLQDQDFASCNRDLIQYVLYDKAARQAQLDARRAAARQEPLSEPVETGHSTEDCVCDSAPGRREPARSTCRRGARRDCLIGHCGAAS